MTLLVAADSFARPPRAARPIRSRDPPSKRPTPHDSVTEASIDSTIQPRAAFPDLPATHAVEQAFGSERAARRQRVLVLPVLANPLCEHHLVVYTADLAGERLRLVAFSKRESVDPKVPSRDWSELCRADMPAERIDEFVDLLQDRLHGAPLELQDIHPQDEATGEDEEEVIGFVVVMPDKLPLNFDNHHVMAIETGNRARCPDIGELGKLLGEVDFVAHGLATASGADSDARDRTRASMVLTAVLRSVTVAPYSLTR